MNIGLFIPSLTKYDAMGNDVISMYEILKDLNYNVVIYASSFDTSIDAEILHIDKSNDFLNNIKNILIYHHGVSTDFYNKLVNAKCKKIFRYHNITYPELFEGYDETAVKICHEGRMQMKGTVDKFDLYFSCSEFNNNELISQYNVAPEKTFILPPFHRIENWLNIKPDISLISEFQKSNTLNFLTVGRLSPNKNHQLLIKSFFHYNANYNTKSKLHIVGKIGPKKYYKELLFLIKEFGLEQNIKLYTEGISEDRLKTLYQHCDLFIMTSLHEGFCVPIVESMYFKLPILSLSSTALVDTVGNNGLLIDNNDPLIFSIAINEMQLNKTYLSNLSHKGYQRFKFQSLKENFISLSKKFKGLD